MFFDNFFNDFNPFNTYSYRQPRPQTSSLYRNDQHSVILRKLLNDDYNYMCFDCHRETRELDYFDLKNGIFLCYNCAQQHAKLPKEISQPMTGNIRTLEDNDLLILYYGGNKNLFEFIRRHYPHLENMNINSKYSTLAMDYYRKLLRAKAFNEPEPEMPGKRKAYNSIYQKKVSPARENQPHKNIRERDTNNEYEEPDIFNSTFFGDDLFNRNKRNQREKERKVEEDKYFGAEPADIKKDNKNENDDAGMKVEKRNSIHNKKDKKEVKEPKTEKKINHSQNKSKEEKQKIVEDKYKNDNTPNVLTINQIGELSMYPDAFELDKMDCE